MTDFYVPPGASIGHRWLVRQLGSGPSSLAMQHGITESALSEAAIEAEVYRFAQNGSSGTRCVLHK